jgi:hypothetical protein
MQASKSFAIMEMNREPLEQTEKGEKADILKDGRADLKKPLTSPGGYRNSAPGLPASRASGIHIGQHHK